jgi:hypothetical protein
MVGRYHGGQYYAGSRPQSLRWLGDPFVQSCLSERWAATQASGTSECGQVVGRQMHRVEQGV